MIKKYSMKKEGNLYRITALRDFGNVKKGDKGGLIEKESNLSHDGSAWVYGDAQVSGSARVSENAWVSGYARVYGHAQVYGDAWVIGGEWFGPPLYIQGSRHALTNCKPGYIAIGCEIRSFEVWLRDFEKIGKSHGYSPEEIKEYGEHIKYIAENGV